jgi:Domain of unknown function (DUF4380)
MQTIWTSDMSHRGASSARSAFVLVCGSLAVCGSGASGATSSGATAMHPVVPSKISDSDYRFKMTACHLVMDVNPKIGGRVSTLMIGSENIITPYGCGTGAYNGGAACNNSGSTFWTSPQAAWPSGTWPPISSIDGNAYAPNVNGDHLIMTGSDNAALGARVDKDFSADDKTCSIALRYTIKASKPIAAAPWEITRVPRGGIAFFPEGESTRLAAGPLSPYTTTTIATTLSIVWVDDSAKAAPVPAGGAKLVADGTGGWLAYALHDVLFIKKFTHVPPALIAPREGDIEIYPGSDYLELEVQGAYTQLNVGDSIPWTVQWRAVTIPSTVSVTVGSATLLAFARQQAAM